MDKANSISLIALIVMVSIYLMITTVSLDRVEDQNTQLLQQQEELWIEFRNHAGLHNFVHETTRELIEAAEKQRSEILNGD